MNVRDISNELAFELKLLFTREVHQYKDARILSDASKLIEDKINDIVSYTVNSINYDHSLKGELRDSKTR